MVSLEVPGDPLRTEMIGRPQVENLLYVLWWDLPRMASSYGALAEQGVSSACFISLLPSVERRSGYIKVAACLDDASNPLGVLENRAAAVGAEGISYLMIHIETSFRVH